jgi:hypothetical protein
LEEDVLHLFDKNLAEVEVHGFDWKSLIFQYFHKITLRKFYFRLFSFSIPGKKKVWPPWLEYLL